MRYTSRVFHPCNYDHAARIYKAIAPVREHIIGTARNIRPIGPRWRKWERMVKFSDGAYGLLSGYTQDSHPHSQGKVSRTCRAYAPIIWSRKDGKDIVSIRYCGHKQANGFMNFINDYLPPNMRFSTVNGQYFLYVRMADGNVKKYSLHRSVAKYGDTRLSFVAHGTPEGKHWDHSYSEYKIPDLSRKRIIKRVNTDKKKRYAESIAAFSSWAEAILPMLHTESWQARTELRKEVQDYVAERHKVKHHWGRLPSKIALEALVDEAHPMRLPLAKMLKVHTYADWWGKEKEPTRDLYVSRRNAFINQTFGFMKEVTVDI